METKRMRKKVGETEIEIKKTSPVAAIFLFNFTRRGRHVHWRAYSLDPVRATPLCADSHQDDADIQTYNYLIYLFISALEFISSMLNRSFIHRPYRFSFLPFPYRLLGSPSSLCPLITFPATKPSSLVFFLPILTAFSLFHPLLVMASRNIRDYKNITDA